MKRPTYDQIEQILVVVTTIAVIAFFAFGIIAQLNHIDVDWDIIEENRGNRPIRTPSALIASCTLSRSIPGPIRSPQFPGLKYI